MNFEEACCQALKADGSRLTSARRSIIRALAQASGPVSAREVINQARKVDPVSVYRTLDRLAELNMLHPVQPQGSYLPCHHGQCAHASHVLLACRKCGHLAEIHLPDEILGPLFWYLSETHHFKGDHHLFQINGLCRECQE